MTNQSNEIKRLRKENQLLQDENAQLTAALYTSKTLLDGNATTLPKEDSIHATDAANNSVDAEWEEGE